MFKQLPNHRRFLALHLTMQLLDLLRIKPAFFMKKDGQLTAVGCSQLADGIQVFVLFLGLLFQGPRALYEFVLFQGQGDGQSNVVIVPGFEDEPINGTFLDGPHDSVGVGVAGEHDADGIRPTFPNFSQQFATVHARHHEVCHDQLDRLFLHDAQGLCSILGKQKFIVLTLENPT